MKEIDWEERHFQICLALLSRTETGIKGSTIAPDMPMIIKRADRMVELLKEHHKIEDDAITSEETGETVSEETLIPTENRTGKVGYKNAKGEWVIDPIFDEAHYFSDGLALVELDGKYGYINMNGDFIIEPKFDHAYDFEQSVAFASEDFRTFGLIDKAGKWIHEPMFDSVWSFKAHGYARVKVHPDRAEGDDSCYLWIDKSGKCFVRIPE